MSAGCRRFEDRNVVVTGGGSGIGEAAVLRFAREGAKVIVADVDIDAAKRVAVSAESAGGVVRACDFDQSDAASIESLALTAERDGGADVICINAGVGAPTTAVVDVEPRDWDRIHAVNLRGAFLTAQRFVSLLRASTDPSVIFTASTAALRAHPGRLPYAASKGGLTALSRSLAVELGPEGIRVNAVCPGGTLTPLALSVARDPAYEAALDELRERIPLRRIAEPEDVAAAIAFLASEDARHITGVDLVVDGGQSVVP